MSNKDELVLHWGIIGSGLIVQDFTAALKSMQSDKHEVYAIYDRNINDAKKYADRFRPKMYTDSLDTFLADPVINIVYIGTVNQTHRDLSLKVIEAGKNVICEKPMCLTTSDQEQVLKAAKEKNVFFMEVYDKYVVFKFEFFCMFIIY